MNSTEARLPVVQLLIFHIIYLGARKGKKACQQWKSHSLQNIWFAAKVVIFSYITAL